MLAWLQRHGWLVIGLVAVPILIGIGVLIDRQLQGPQPLEIRLDNTPATEIQVYVAGAVQRPGVYYLSDGDRWIDALEAAGGPTADADVEAANMALRLHDEDQVLIPRLGDQPHSVLGAAEEQRVDLNTASADLLDSLPGIGEVRSQRIVESRQSDGPFSRPEELVERGLIPQSVLEQIRELITVSP